MCLWWYSYYYENRVFSLWKLHSFYFALSEVDVQLYSVLYYFFCGNNMKKETAQISSFVCSFSVEYFWVGWKNFIRSIKTTNAVHNGECWARNFSNRYTYFPSSWVNIWSVIVYEVKLRVLYLGMLNKYD